MRARHPGLHALLGKLQRNEALRDDEVARLQRLMQPEAPVHGDGKAMPRAAGLPDLPDAATSTLRPGHASTEGSARFASRFAGHSESFYRAAQDLFVSSVGIGTYRRTAQLCTDGIYTEAVHTALSQGINLIDTSLNYCHQGSERGVGAALRRFIDQDGGRRDEVVLCTKGGFLVPDAIDIGTLTVDEIAGNIHCIAPAFLADQIQRSRRNLGVATIDIYYVHNPEVQLAHVGASTFDERIRKAFAQLETAVQQGEIRYYGIATWHGFEGGENGLSLRSLAELARDIAGDGHHFRFIQLPVNMGMQDALEESEQGSLLALAGELGMSVIGSAGLFQGRLTQDLPEEMAALLPGLDNDAQRAIQFARSAPGITSALVGMRQAHHVRENLALARLPPLQLEAFRRLQHFMGV